MTRYPWRVAPEELFALRGHGGQTFTDFVNAVIRAEAAAGRLNLADIYTSTRVNIGDRGVDVEVKPALCGYLDLRTPSCWQIKAMLFSDITEADLRREANKAAAKRLIEGGYAYYVCVCDDWPPNKMRALEDTLQGIVREINTDAPTARILNASHLADWASRFLAIVLQFFRPYLAGALSYDAWLRKERAHLPTFVELPARAEAAEKFVDHVNADKPTRALFTIAGPSGAGISRLVAETLSSVADRVIYIADAATCLGLATSLVNQTDLSAILVLDGCPVHARMAIDELMKAETARLRAIVIQDPSEVVSHSSLVMSPLEDADVQRVIDANFVDVPSNHRRAFVQFADGILKIAAKLGISYCSNRSNFLLDSGSWGHDELQRLVRDDRDRMTLQALALFKRVGHKDAVASQLGAVCDLFGLDVTDVLRRCKRLATSPGVVAFGPRYLSVRPRLFAGPLFESAWMEWVEHDVGSFIEKLPNILGASLLEQAGTHAPKSAREALADWAIPRIRTFAPADLSRAEQVGFLLPLVEVSPARIGPLLTDFVERATDEESRATGDLIEDWPARSHVLRCLGNLLGRGETYALAESALFRMARAEGDPEVAVRQSSSATERWATSFRIYLSGTEVSFKERIERLASKLDAFGSDVVPLVIAAPKFVLESHAWKIEGKPVVAGAVRPPDWHPSTYGEIWESLSAAIALLGRCLADSLHKALAFRVLASRGRYLLRNGRLEDLRGILDAVALDEHQRAAVLGFIDEFLDYDCKPEKEDKKEHDYPSDYVESVAAWRKNVARHDLASRLARMISIYFFRRRFEEEDAWLIDIDALGAELYNNREELERQLPSLANGDHDGRALLELGRAIGKRDDAGTLLSTVLAAAGTATNPLFPRGYVLGLTNQGERHDSRLEAELDRLEELNPKIAVDLNERNNRIGSAGTRAIRLVRTRRLEPGILAQMWSLRLDECLFAEAMETILDVLTDQPENAAATALELLGVIAWNANAALPKDDRLIEAMWRVLEVAVGGARGQAHTWAPLLRLLLERDFERAVRLACVAAVKGDLSIQDEAVCELSAYIEKQPRFVLDTLGPLLLEPEGSWRFSVGRRGAVLNAFPFDILRQWILENGRSAALAVAPHMLPPYIEDGRPMVPPLTELVLSQFESDDQVFSRFCRGVHNFQLYSGDIADQHEQEAAHAELFRTHPFRRIREWADQEFRSARWNAQRWREHEEENLDD